MEPPKNKDSDKMIDDKDFERLIEAEYQKQGRPVDELAKQRIWETLNTDKKNETTTSQKLQKFKIGFVLAASLAAMVGSFQYFQTTDSDPYSSMRPKGVLPGGENLGIKGVHAGIEYYIATYIHDAEGKLIALDNSTKKEGDIIVPAVVTSVAAAAVLVKEIGSEQYEAVSTAEMTDAGTEHYFARDGESAGISIEAQVETYCVFITDSMPTMGTIIGDLPEIKDKAKVKIECFSL